MDSVRKKMHSILAMMKMFKFMFHIYVCTISIQYFANLVWKQ